MAQVTLSHVTKIYDDVRGRETAVEDVSFEVREGELLTLVGPSGCGKSTTLRLVAGLEAVTDGTIEFDGRTVQNDPPTKRNVAMVFQNYALYSKMTAKQNMEFGLKHAMNLSANVRADSVRQVADMLGIEELLDKRPDQLSGGEKQRVALGRAIVRDPEVFLMDEPLSNLDAKRRSQMRTEVQRIHNKIGVATIYVTHDQKEAMTMGDRIAVMNDGRIEQVASPDEAYDDPNNLFVATFLGSPAMNVVPCLARSVGESIRLEMGFDGPPLTELPATSVDSSYRDSEVLVGLRPEDIILQENQSELGVSGEVMITEYQGKEYFVHVNVEGEDLIVRSRRQGGFSVGDEIGLTVQPSDIYLFDPETEEALKTRRTPLSLNETAA